MENQSECTIDVTELSKPMYLSLALGIMLLIAYFAHIGKVSLLNNIGENQSAVVYGLVFILGIILSVFLHEGLHAITFLLFSKCSLSAIKFGFYKGNPYCHCNSKIKVKHYKVVLLAPFLLLGILLYILGIYTGDSIYILLGIFNIVCAIGDVCVYRLLKSLPNESYIKDHPSKIGFYLYS